VANVPVATMMPEGSVVADHGREKKTNQRLVRRYEDDGDGKGGAIRTDEATSAEAVQLVVHAPRN